MSEPTASADLAYWLQGDNVKHLLNPGRVDGGEAAGLVSHPGDLEGLHASLHILAKDVMDKLTSKYRGWMWGVQPLRGGVINIFCLNFSSSWGYAINIDDIQNDPNRRAAMRAGGEVLRRFGIHSNHFNIDQYKAVKRNPRGEAIPEVSDLPRTRFTLAASIEKAMAEGRTRVVSRGTDGSAVIEVVR